MRVDKKRMAQAAILLSIATVSFGIAWATWSASPGVRCVGPDISDTAIRECVAEQARETEPNAPTLAALVIGTAALGASLVTGVRATRRVMTVAGAAQQLGMQPGAVRQLIDNGTLEIYDHEPGAIYLNPEDVHRLAIQASTQDQPARA